MKNILAENMIRFGTKNLSESIKSILQEQDPKGSTISPEIQAKVDKLIAGTQTLVTPLNGLRYGIGGVKVPDANFYGPAADQTTIMHIITNARLVSDVTGAEPYVYIQFDSKQENNSAVKNSTNVSISNTMSFRIAETPGYFYYTSAGAPGGAIKLTAEAIKAGFNYFLKKQGMKISPKTDVATYDKIVEVLNIITNKYSTGGIWMNA